MPTGKTVEKTPVERYMDMIMTALGADEDNSNYGEIYQTGVKTLNQVTNFLTARNAIVDNKSDSELVLAAANENLGFEDAMAGSSDLGAEFVKLFDSCKLAKPYRKECAHTILNIMERQLKKHSAEAWRAQSIERKNLSNSNAAEVRTLYDIYPSDTVMQITNLAKASDEAFGVNIDTATPDLRVSITVAIMNFHTRLLPRIIPTKSINQPEVSYVKEYEESFDLADFDNKGKTLLDLTSDPALVANELKRIVPLYTNPEGPEYLLADGIIKFNKQVDLFKLSVDETKFGFSKTNRTDLVAENVKLEYVYVTIGGDQFKIPVPLSKQRLTRIRNNEDTATRYALINFNYRLSKALQTKKADGTESTLIQALADDETVVLYLQLSPTIVLKNAIASCTGMYQMSVVCSTPGKELSQDAQALAGMASDVTLDGYILDARFSEENLRKSSIAIWSNRQEFSYDIPIGRNYIYDYPIGGENADQNATNLTKTIGLGQDHVALKTVLMRTMEDVADRIAIVGPRPEKRIDYVGASYVAGDKVRPTIYQGVLDFTQLNEIRDADRPGDIKQKALTFLNAVTTNVLYDSQLLYQLDGAGVTFRCVTSMTILGKILSQPHIHNHMDKEDARDLGDGIEYVLVLPNGVRIEFVTSPFLYMKDRLVMWPIIKNNAESELNFAMNYDYGTLVAHYTPGASGRDSFHRLFANIRELPIVTNPVGLIIDVEGMDYVNDIVDDGVYLRPTINIQTNGNINVNGNIGENGGEGAGDGNNAGAGDNAGAGAGTGTGNNGGAGTGTNP